MVRLCNPGKVSELALAGLLVAYIGGIATAQANPGALAPHSKNALTQGGNVAALAALLVLVRTYNARKGCVGKWTWSWVTLCVLGLNLVARLGVIGVLKARGTDADNYKAKYVRWDQAAAVGGMVAVLAEMYYALVPQMRFRTVFFFLALVFALPVALALPRMFGGTNPDADILRVSVELSQTAYGKYDGKDQATRVHAESRTLTKGGHALYVSFAGTENATDVKVDVNIADTPLPAGWRRAGDPEARAHKGFVDLYAQLREGVRAKVRNLLTPETRAVVLTGHSLGGALATLAALDLANAPVVHPQAQAAVPVHAYTFGAPQIGDGAFVKQFNARVPHCVRVVNPFDPVPKLLATQLLHTKGYYPVASLTLDSPLTAHNLSTYALAIKRPAWLRTLGVFAPLTYLGAAAGGVALYHFLRNRAGA